MAFDIYYSSAVESAFKKGAKHNLDARTFPLIASDPVNGSAKLLPCTHEVPAGSPAPANSTYVGTVQELRWIRDSRGNFINQTDWNKWEMNPKDSANEEILSYLSKIAKTQSIIVFSQQAAENEAKSPLGAEEIAAGAKGKIWPLTYYRLVTGEIVPSTHYMLTSKGKSAEERVSAKFAQYADIKTWMVTALPQAATAEEYVAQQKAKEEAASIPAPALEAA